MISKLKVIKEKNITKNVKISISDALINRGIQVLIKRWFPFSPLNFTQFWHCHLGMNQDFKLVGAEFKKKKKKNPNRHYIVLKIYKYLKSLFINILRCNHLPTKIKTKKKKCFFNTRLVMIFFFFVKVRAFTVVVLKILIFSTSKSYFIYFTTSL